LINKRGRLEGETYFCRRYGKCEDEARWSAMIELEPADESGQSNQAIDFSAVLSIADAKEI